MLHKALYSFLLNFGNAGATTIQQGFDFIVHLRYVPFFYETELRLIISDYPLVICYIAIEAMAQK